MEEPQRQPYLAGKIEDVMTLDPLIIVEDEPINKLVDLFIYYQFHGLPVVNNKGRLVGIVRDSEVLAMFVSREPYVGQYQTVGDIMHKPPFIINRDSTIQNAVFKMFVDGTRFLVVVDKEQEIVGVVTRIDLIKGIKWKDPDN